MKWIISVCILCFCWHGYAQEKSTLEVVSWNVFLRPGFLRDNQMGRVDSIANYLNSTGADVLVLQEVFHNRARKCLINHLAENYPHHTKVGITSFFGVSSGVIIFSKTEILREKHIYFKRAIKADKLAKKGGVLAIISVNGKSVEIIGTHLQAGGGKKGAEIRKEQITQLNTLPTTIYRPTIFAGDFNIHRHSKAYKDLEDLLDCMNHTPSGSLQSTANFCDHELTKASGNPSWIDFILIRKAGRIRSLFSRIEQPMFRNKGKSKRLSDHNPIFSTIDLSEVSPALQ